MKNELESFIECEGPHPPLRGTLSRKRERDPEGPRPASAGRGWPKAG